MVFYHRYESCLWFTNSIRTVVKPPDVKAGASCGRGRGHIKARQRRGSASCTDSDAERVAAAAPLPRFAPEKCHNCARLHRTLWKEPDKDLMIFFPHCLSCVLCPLPPFLCPVSSAGWEENTLQLHGTKVRWDVGCFGLCVFSFRFKKRTTAPEWPSFILFQL